MVFIEDKTKFLIPPILFHYTHNDKDHGYSPKTIYFFYAAVKLSFHTVCDTCCSEKIFFSDKVTLLTVILSKHQQYSSRWTSTSNTGQPQHVWLKIKWITSHHRKGMFQYMWWLSFFSSFFLLLKSDKSYLKKINI